MLMICFALACKILNIKPYSLPIADIILLLGLFDVVIVLVIVAALVTIL